LKTVTAVAASQTRAAVVGIVALALTLSLALEGSSAPRRAKQLNLSITFISGEHSRDSNSTTISITLNANHVHYGKSYAGYRAGRRTPIDKNVQINNEELERIHKLLVENDLLRSHSSISPTNQPGSYVEISATIQSGSDRSVLKFSGMRENAEKDKLYVGLESLFSQLEQIVNP
jgi:hypothetical protein